MAICGHCGIKIFGIKDHLKDKHGYPFYCMGPDFKTYFGKNDPPHLQKNDWPDKSST